jgi:hypothetical protein
MAKLLSEATGTGAGGTTVMAEGFRTVQAYGATSTSTGTATIDIQVSNTGDLGTWLTVATLTIATATGASLAAAIAAGTPDGASFINGWRFVRANMTALTGTYSTISGAQTGIWVDLQ